MTVLRESPWYQEIFREGELLGEQRGQIRERLSNIELSLEVKFGKEGLNLLPRISQISDFDKLREIQLSILTSETLEQLQLVIENLSPLGEL